MNQNGGITYPVYNAGWAEEIALDVQAVHALCQNCNILLVEATTPSDTNLITVADARAFLMGANVVSNSWGGSEFNYETSYDTYYNHPGVAYVFSSGDSNYGVQYPAASPNVTAVGGTKLLVNSDYTYNSETVWSHDGNGTGSGCSAYEAKPGFQNDPVCSTHRTVTDVPADADPDTGAAVYITAGIHSGWYQIGGTSLAAPLVAAVFALAGGVGDRTGEFAALCQPELRRQPTRRDQRQQRQLRRFLPAHTAGAATTTAPPVWVRPGAAAFSLGSSGVPQKSSPANSATGQPTGPTLQWSCRARSILL